MAFNNNSEIRKKIEESNNRFKEKMTPEILELFKDKDYDDRITLAEYEQIDRFNSYDLRYIQEFATEEILWKMLESYSNQTVHAGPLDIGGNTYNEIIVSVLVPKLLKLRKESKI